MLRGPLDSGLQRQDVSPSPPCYQKLQELQELVTKNIYNARLRQKRNYDKHHREVEYQGDDRVWLRTHPYSKAEKSFTAKLAPKCQGPYRIVKRTGQLNYQIVHEATGEDLRVVHVSGLKPCYPNAKEWDALQRQKVLDIFAEESEAEDFLGFGDQDQSFRPIRSVFPWGEGCDSALSFRNLN